MVAAPARHRHLSSQANVAEITDIDVVEETDPHRLVEPWCVTASRSPSPLHSFSALGEADGDAAPCLSVASPALTTAGVASIEPVARWSLRPVAARSAAPARSTSISTCSGPSRPPDDHRDDVVELRARSPWSPGARIQLPFPSVGATEQFLFASVLAEGDSELATRSDRT